MSLLYKAIYSRAGRVFENWPLIGPKIKWLRKLNLYDVLLISFPKCGRTWLLVLLGRAIQQHFEIPSETPLNNPATMSRYNAAIPTILPTHKTFFTEKRIGSLTQFRQKKIVLLVRDPRDVVVSRYFQITKRKNEIKFNGSMAEFVYARQRSFNSFLDYYHQWARVRHQLPELLLVRYEDLHAQTEEQLTRVLAFCGLPQISQQTIAEAVAFADFNNMQRLEAKGFFQSGKLRPRDLTDFETFKTRRGKVGGYVDYLAPKEIEYMTYRMAKELDQFYGYHNTC
ncbi:MAG: sulfotransferase domain-containing protein [Anaerolineae bacterium]|nr:sulfotransferase domain-containing protein [Anaerolineae bacterium]